MAKIKVCGVKTLEDARAAAQAGADLLGFHFSKRSAQAVSQDDALRLCGTLRDELGGACPVLVGVFVNELVSNISAVLSKVGLDAAQLDGDESDVMLKELRGIGFKRIQPMNMAMAHDDVGYYGRYWTENERLPSLMLDVFHTHLKDPGTAIAQAIKEGVPRLMLTGGFTVENVAEQLAAIQPWGVDVLLGDGGVDVVALPAFVAAVRG